MYVDFRTEDERQIIKTILENGELQLTEKERLVGQQALFKDVAKIVSERCVNPENNRAYTATMVEKMMKDCHISLKANKNVKQHALEVIKQLRSTPGFKIAPSMMEVIISIQKDAYEPVFERLLQLCNEVIRQSESADGLCELAAVVEPEKYGSIEALLHSEIKGRYCIEIADSTKYGHKEQIRSNPGYKTERNSRRMPAPVLPVHLNQKLVKLFSHLRHQCQLIEKIKRSPGERTKKVPNMMTGLMID
ncbi:unnamed protein product [Heterobilharzia americana]|nr:unnamed protein product [Heterobilharzia americana]